MTTIKIIVTSAYGVLSRGRHSARLGRDAQEWAKKNAKGQLVITQSGEWYLHCSDGYKRSARAMLAVEDDGSWEMSGDTARFGVVEN